MNYYSISQLVNFFSLTFLAIFVISNNYRNKVNQTYALLNFGMALWCLFYFLWMFNLEYSPSFFYLKCLMAAAISIPVLFTHFIFNYLKIEAGKFYALIFMYLFAGVCEYLNYFNLLYSIMKHKLGLTWWPDAGSLYFVYLFYFYCGLFIAVLLMLRALFNPNQQHKNQILYLFVASSMAIIAGTLNFPLWYDIPVLPILNPLFSIYAVIVAYTIVVHHLLDIKIFIRKGLIYSLILGLISGGYIAFLNMSNYLIVGNNVSMPFHVPATAIPPLLSSAAFISLGIFVLLKGKNKKVSLPFFYFCFFTFWWQFTMFLNHTYHSAAMAVFFVKMAYTGIIFIPIAFNQFVLNLVDYPQRKLISRIFYGIGILFLCTLWFTNKFISGYYEYSWGYYPKADYLHLLYLLCLVIMNCIGVYGAAKKYYSTNNKNIKSQLLTLFFAFCIYLIAVVDFLINYGFDFYPPGYLFILTSLIIMIYAIFKYNMIEVLSFIKKGVLYSLLIGLIAGGYLSLISSFSFLVKNISQSFSLVFSSILMIIFAILFQPLRDKLQEIIDHTFYRGKYDYQKTLKELSQAAVSITDLNELINKVFDAIVHTLHIKNISIYVLDKSSGEFTLKQTVGTNINMGPLSATNNLLINKLNDKKEALIFEENPDITGVMGELKATIIFPMYAKNELVGFMSLGEKLSGEVYSSEDIDLLTTLCSQMGISIENSMLIDEALDSQKRLFQADKLATVGALAAGLAHEIKNPIAAIKGFSQMIGKAIKENDTEAIKDFESVVPRQLDRVNEIVEKLLYLSKPTVLKREKVKINTLLDEVVSLVEKQAMKNKVQIVKNFADVPVIDADPDQLSQAFLNLTLNSIQAIKTEGQVEIRSRLSGTDGVIVEFIDNGVGIQKELVSKIFDPFFTTKDQGSGLGLSVTRRIIMEHHGKISVSSQAGEGTTFTVELPLGSK